MFQLINLTELGANILITEISIYTSIDQYWMEKLGNCRVQVKATSFHCWHWHIFFISLCFIEQIFDILTNKTVCPASCLKPADLITQKSQTREDAVYHCGGRRKTRDSRHFQYLFLTRKTIHHTTSQKDEWGAGEVSHTGNSQINFLWPLQLLQGNKRP